MNIEIVPSTQEETKAFEEGAWRQVDKEHWGRDITWNISDYRFVAKLSGEIVGLVFGKYEAETTYVDNLVVSEKHRGNGIGTKLMTFIEDWTIKQGGHKVWLVTHVNWKVNALYKKLGYQNTCVLKKHFLGEDFILYEKFLT